MSRDFMKDYLERRNNNPKTATQADLMKEYLERRNNNPRKTNLENVFKAYARDTNTLNLTQLKDAFDQLGSMMPYKDAEEAMKAANINPGNVVSSNSNEFKYIVEYAYNKGFRAST